MAEHETVHHGDTSTDIPEDVFDAGPDQDSEEARNAFARLDKEEKRARWRDYLEKGHTVQEAMNSAAACGPVG